MAFRNCFCLCENLNQNKLNPVIHMSMNGIKVDFQSFFSFGY